MVNFKFKMVSQLSFLTIIRIPTATALVRGDS